LPVVAADLQSALRDGEALLHIGFEWGALITGDSIVLRRTSFDRRKLNNAIRTFVGSVATSKDSLAPVRLDLGHVIWESVIGPYTEALDGIDHIWLDLPGLLDQVPFEALVTEPPDTATWMPDSPEAPAWALRRFSFAYIPSLTSFQVLATLPQSSGDLALLGLGAPVLEGDAKGQISIESILTDGRPDPDKLLRLAPLPHAAIELDSMAAAVGIDAAELIVGPDFVRSRMEAQPWDDARTIVFATHGLIAAGAAPLSHLLVLTPEAPGGPPPVLTPEDIRGQVIDSDLVLLSACDTGIVTDAIRQAGVSAFADSFMIAGARSVLVSRWPVLSAAVPSLTVPVIDRAAELGSGHAARTLRRIALAAIDDPNLTEIDDPKMKAYLSHPATWGAFAVVGDVPPSRLSRPLEP
jgi:CHAT domain-containing protein